eukprot:TRINITY_DN11870_c0_g1_i9.p1 TRINITY_DN11870_c0_g1~~TRINITY_DN11870_c0_g1_i9.p1  ORF type:complete len:677 (+),score=139.69 TRINITY_DN11870_c0_g1_i9:204-2033(+)
MTPLLLAVSTGHFDLAQLLVGHGADVTLGSGDGLTALHVACGQGDAKSTEWLLGLGASPTVAEDSHLDTPIHIAAAALQRPCLELLLRSPQSNLGIRNRKGHTPLHALVIALLALSEDDPQLDLLGFLLALDPPHLQDNSGQTPLHYAAAKGHAELSRQLIAASPSSITVADKKQQTPLHLACRSGSLQTVNAILATCEPGVLMDLLAQRDDFSLTPLLCASCSGNSVELLRLLVGAGADLKAVNDEGAAAIHFAAVQGDTAAVEFLVASGIEIDQRTKDGTTPLLTCAKYAKPPIALVHYLLDSGADVDAQDQLVRQNRKLVSFWLLSDRVWCLQGMTPLLYAAQESSKSDFLNVILAHGASVEKSDAIGQTALFYAAQFGQAKAIQVLLLVAEFVVRLLLQTLLAWGASPNVRSMHPIMRGRSPLHTAALFGHREIIEILLVNGAIIEILDAESRTVLHAAAGGGDVATAALLLRFGVPINWQSSPSAMTALHTAAANGNFKMVQFLIGSGADPNLLSFDDFTALEVAELRGFKEIAEYLRPHTTAIPLAERQLQGFRPRGAGGVCSRHLFCSVFFFFFSLSADACLADQSQTRWRSSKRACSCKGS